MSERRTIRLTKANAPLAHRGVDAAINKGAKDGKPWTMELRESTRTDEQNDALHGLIDQILKQRPKLHGVRMDKVRYKAVFMQALGHEIQMLPTLSGDGFFPLGLSTSRLTVSEFTALIEWVLAWCAEQGLEVKHFDAARDEGSANNAPSAAA